MSILYGLPEEDIQEIADIVGCNLPKDDIVTGRVEGLLDARDASLPYTLDGYTDSDIG